MTTIEPVLEQAENILTEMRMFKHEKGWQYDDDMERTVNVRSSRLDFFFVFIVDVVNQKGYMLVCGARELELAQAAFPDGTLSTAFPGIKPVGKTIGPEQTLLSVGSRVSRKKEYAPDLMKACDDFSKTKDADGRVNDDQEDEDSFLEGAEVVYKQGGEKLEIDYSAFKQGFSSGIKAKIRMMGKLQVRLKRDSRFSSLFGSLSSGLGSACCSTFRLTFRLTCSFGAAGKFDVIEKDGGGSR